MSSEKSLVLVEERGVRRLMLIVSLNSVDIHLMGLLKGFLLSASMSVLWKP